MSDKDEQEAREELGRAGRQGSYAAKNATKAARLAGEAAAEEARDTLSHAAGETREAAEEVTETTKRVVPRISAHGLAAISGDTGTGFLALAVSIYSGAIAYHKFRSAIEGRGRAID